MNQLNFLSSNGEMGKLIREKDWSNHPLGNPINWPQSLKTTLSIILNSKFPKFLFWGADLRCFYNDAYRPSLGFAGKHPTILGQQGIHAFPEVWNIIKPMMDQVLQTGEATWSENQLIPLYRNGRIEDIYWTFSYSPIVDEQGNIAGIFTSVIETTAEVNNRKALEAVSQRYHENIMRAPVAMCVLSGANFIVEIANKLMLELWGKTIDDVSDKPIFEGLPESKGQGLEAILNEVYSTGVRFEGLEHPILLPRNGILESFYLNFVYEPVKNNEGKVVSIVAIAIDITSSVLARQKVQESEERFRRVADNAPVLIWMSGTDKLCHYFNKAWLQFSGRTMDQENGNGWAEGVHPDDLDRCIEIYTSNFDKHQDFYMEYRLRRHDGEYRWLSDNGVPRFTPEGVFEGFIGACMDIHDSVTAQTILKENEEKLNIVIAASQLAMWEYDVATGKAIVSELHAVIYGHPLGVYLDNDEIKKQLHPDDEEIRETAHQAVLETGYLHYESRITWPDGSIHWIEVNGKLFYGAQNAPIKMVGTVRDISREKWDKEALKNREEKFRILANEMPQFVWTTDANGQIDYFNKSIYNYSGLEEGDLDNDRWTVIVHPDDVLENLKRWNESVKTGNDYVVEHRFRRKDGIYRWQLSRAKPLKDSAGNIKMWVGTSTDIQDIKEIDEQKDYFISMASHELKTPITSIKGYVQLLEGKYKNAEDPFLKTSLGVVNKQIETLTTLVGDLLDVSKIKTGNLEPKKTSFNFNKLIRDVITEIQHINPKNDINFEESFGVNVFADEENIRQVIVNFLTNAVKYSPQSKEVLVQLTTANSEIMCSVADYGIGISPENQVKIFERFFRVEGKNEKTFPGFGIGLYIAAEIIRKHHGKIGVNSEIGKGSTFYFTLPI